MGYRDNAIIEGTVIIKIDTVASGDDEDTVSSSSSLWLKASRLKQAAGQQQQQEWINAPQNVYLPFEYNNHYYLQKFIDTVDN